VLANTSVLLPCGRPSRTSHSSAAGLSSARTAAHTQKQQQQHGQVGSQQHASATAVKECQNQIIDSCLPAASRVASHLQSAKRLGQVLQVPKPQTLQQCPFHATRSLASYRACEEGQAQVG
jgi:hypothetical protein